jgi:hypothetical protein
MILNYNNFLKESFDIDIDDFINDCYADLLDLGFTFTKTSDSIYGVFNGKISFDDFIDTYVDFVSKLKIEFIVKSHDIKFTEKKVIIEVKLIENNLERVSDSVKLILNGEEKIFKIIKISRNMIDINKKSYLVSIRFFMKNSDSESFIDFNVNWELNWKEVKRNVKNHKRAFINPNCDFYINNSWFRLTGRDTSGHVEVDNENAEKLYKYFKEKGGGWRYGNNEDGERVDFTTQFTSKDLVGNWN